jgi:NAD(P)-dependent dehydrogenase (short-subunit alcohol dehydrogenase family)
MIRSVMITGSNIGLGKESARQFALQEGVEKVYLACRNPAKAEAARKDLEQTTGKSVFEVVPMDVTDLDSVRSAVSSLDGPVDALVMNAGGGTKEFRAMTKYGVTQIFAQNVLGHVVLAEEMLKAEKLTQIAMYVGSEASRGIKKMRINRPNLKSNSVEELTSIADGSYFGNESNPMIQYRFVKYVATLWMSSMARRHPDVRFVTMSPGNTSGTAMFDTMPRPVAFLIKNVLNKIYPLFGMIHGIEVGANRFVQAVMKPKYKSGVFYASKEDRITGEVVDQSTFAPHFANETYQDNAFEVMRRLLHAMPASV